MVKTEDMLTEIHENNLKFYPAMELIAQSNPTLIPFTTFDLNEYKIQNGVHGQTWIDTKSARSPAISEWSLENDSLVFCDDFSSDSDDEDVDYSFEEAINAANAAQMAGFADDY